VEENTERTIDHFLPSSDRSSRDGRDRLRVVPSGEEVDDGTLHSTVIGELDLELGGRLSSVTIAYRTWGKLNDAGDNAVLVVHALTGDSLAGGPGGWWEPLIGPGLALDTDSQFVICSNVVGGCQGSTGPTSVDPLTGRPYAMRFPLITIGDMVNAQRRLIERLGVTKTVVIGGSIGGFQVLDWATRHPEIVSSAVPIAATGSLGAQGIAIHSELGRRAIMADPDWRGGEYASEGVFPTNGLAIARMAAMTAYQSRESIAMRSGRNPATRPGLYPSFGGTFDIEGYLHYQGAKLVRRFDANSYLYLTRAMDLYDVGRNGGDDFWLDKITAPLLFIGIRTDWLFPPDEVQALSAHLVEMGKDAIYAEIDSPHGHDAFLKEWDQLDAVIGPFVHRAIEVAARS